MTTVIGPTRLDVSESDFLTALAHACWNYRQYQQAELRLNNQIKALQRRLGQNMSDTLEPHVEASLEGRGREQRGAQIKSASPLVEHLTHHRDELGAERKKWAKNIEKLAKSLPLWERWARDLRGLGPLSFGQTMAELGDVKRFDNPAKVWKRMGLAVIEGRAQRKTRDKAGAEAQGYSPRRRAIAYLLGENLLRQNRGEFRALYDSRKAHEVATHPDLTKLHVHRRAMRYMVKRLLRDLWREGHFESDTQNYRAPAPEMVAS